MLSFFRFPRLRAFKISGPQAVTPVELLITKLWAFEIRNVWSPQRTGWTFFGFRAFRIGGTTKTWIHMWTLNRQDSGRPADWPAMAQDKNLMGYALCRRPLTISHFFKIEDSWHICKRILDFRCTNLLFGVSGASTLTYWGKPGTSLGPSGAQTKTLWRSGVDFLLTCDNLGSHVESSLSEFSMLGKPIA